MLKDIERFSVICPMQTVLNSAQNDDETSVSTTDSVDEFCLMNTFGNEISQVSQKTPQEDLLRPATDSSNLPKPGFHGIFRKRGLPQNP